MSSVAAVLFIALVGALVFVVARGVDRMLGRRAATIAVSAILGWLAVTAVLAAAGVLGNFSATPPPFLFVTVPAFAAAIVFAMRPAVGAALGRVSQAQLVGVQSFRFVMEVVLWLLFLAGSIPQRMTFEGRNIDIVVGITAALAYPLLRAGRVRVRTITTWNLFGLLILGNIVVIAILSAPTSFRVFTDGPANTVIGEFPFVWLPTFVVPVAIALHILSLRKAAIERKVLDLGS